MNPDSVYFHSSEDPSNEWSCRSSESTSDATDRPDFLDIDTRSSDSHRTMATKVTVPTLHTRRRASTEERIPTQPSRSPQPPDSLSRKSFRRALSLMPLDLPPPTLAPATPSPPPSSIKSFIVAPRQSRLCIDQAPFVPEEPPGVKYYQDSEARKQLRHYLASPQKFDEAIEFGFPFPDAVIPSPSGTGDDFPFHGALLTCDDASFESHGPHTPTAESDHRHLTVAHQSSFDSEGGLLLQLNTEDKAAKSWSSSVIRNREMTIRMTPTRSDLRASEEQTYRPQRTQISGAAMAEADPLALDRITVCDDSTGAHGAFAINQHGAHSKGLKRVWESIRRC